MADAKAICEAAQRSTSVCDSKGEAQQASAVLL
jgi:hypothetical protein